MRPSTTAIPSRRSRLRPRTPRSRRRELIKIDYEELPAVFTVAGALAHDAPAGPGSAASTERPAGQFERPARARHRAWGDTADGNRRSRDREHLHLPDGHPLRHRAARVHRGAGERRRGHLDLDPAPVLAAACARPDPRPAARQGSCPRAGPWRRVRGQAARQVRATAVLHGARDRPAGAPRPDPGGDIPRRSPHSHGDHRPHRRQPRRSVPCSRTSTRTT